MSKNHLGVSGPATSKINQSSSSSLEALRWLELKCHLLQRFNKFHAVSTVAPLSSLSTQRHLRFDCYWNPIKAKKENPIICHNTPTNRISKEMEQAAAAFKDSYFNFFWQFYFLFWRKRDLTLKPSSMFITAYIDRDKKFFFPENIFQKNETGISELIYIFSVS